MLPGWVYLVGNTKLNWFKLGFTRRDPATRFDELQSGVPFELKMFGSWEFRNANMAQAAEQDTHTRYWSQHLRGEWFENLDIEAVAMWLTRLKEKYHNA